MEKITLEQARFVQPIDQENVADSPEILQELHESIKGVSALLSRLDLADAQMRLNDFAPERDVILAREFQGSHGVRLGFQGRFEVFNGRRILYVRIQPVEKIRHVIRHELMHLVSTTEIHVDGTFERSQIGGHVRKAELADASKERSRLRGWNEGIIDLCAIQAGGSSQRGTIHKMYRHLVHAIAAHVSESAATSSDLRTIYEKLGGTLPLSKESVTHLFIVSAIKGEFGFGALIEGTYGRGSFKRLAHFGNERDEDLKIFTEFTPKELRTGRDEFEFGTAVIDWIISSEDDLEKYLRDAKE